ncbi:hypothetical protein BDV93DRAFT_587074 [Ceratobasidium sp. AG-I]|nr:hypothetical protein BDV93DRAFT_587074 [Ceratobasidium sp. AG-I]
MPGVQKEKLFIRPVHTDDTPVLYRICLLTADAGQSAEALHHFPELLGLHYIDPYVKLSPAFGFVLVSGTTKGNEEVLGCLPATPDTRAHEAIAEEQCYPPLRLKYPNNPYPSEEDPIAVWRTGAEDRGGHVSLFSALCTRYFPLFSAPMAPVCCLVYAAMCGFLSN